MRDKLLLCCVVFVLRQPAPGSWESCGHHHRWHGLWKINASAAIPDPQRCCQTGALQCHGDSTQAFGGHQPCQANSRRVGFDHGCWGGISDSRRDSTWRSPFFCDRWISSELAHGQSSKCEKHDTFDSWWGSYPQCRYGVVTPHDAPHYAHQQPFACLIDVCHYGGRFFWQLLCGIFGKATSAAVCWWPAFPSECPLLGRFGRWSCTRRKHPSAFEEAFGEGFQSSLQSGDPEFSRR